MRLQSMTLEEALELIKQHEAKIAGLEGEKSALLNKRTELLNDLAKLKKFKPYQDLDIDALVKFHEEFGGADGGDLKTHYENLYRAERSKLETRIAQIEKEREEEKAARELEQKQLIAERTKSAAMAVLSKPELGVFSPDQLFRLIGDRIKLNEAGEIVAGDELKTLPLADFIQELKADNSYQNQFKASGATGSGAAPGTGGAGAGVRNPWKKETFNLTEQGKLTRENPALANALKAAAGVK